MTDAISLISALVALPAPPGEEAQIQNYVMAKMEAMGYTPQIDAKGNVYTTLGDPARDVPHVLITAHSDEIGLMVVKVEDDGKIRVAALGGSYPWKWGEGAVSLLTANGLITGILSFGCIHTNHENSVVEHARNHPLTWDKAYIFTGKSADELKTLGIRAGTRVVLAPERRTVTEFGEHIASYFLDDRADLAVLLMALEALKDTKLSESLTLTFAATVSEEVGADGAKYLLSCLPAEICVALEIAPKTPEADFPIDATPTIWVRDGYAAMEARDGYLLEHCCAELGMEPRFQYLSRGGSDASCAAAVGLTARAVTLGFPVENSHGYEIMHRDAPDELLRLLLAYLHRVAGV